MSTFSDENPARWFTWELDNRKKRQQDERTCGGKQRGCPLHLECPVHRGFLSTTCLINHREIRPVTSITDADARQPLGKPWVPDLDGKSAAELGQNAHWKKDGTAPC